jgi:hypothetical protein
MPFAGILCAGWWVCVCPASCVMVTSHNILPDQQAQDSGQMSLFGDMRHEMMVSNQWANYLLGSAEANTSSRLTFIVGGC